MRKAPGIASASDLQVRICGNFSPEKQEFTGKSAKLTKGVEDVYEDTFVCFVVNLIFGCR
jgi:hypothetical protein